MGNCDVELNQARETLRNAAWLGTNEDRERIEKAVELLCGEPCEDTISRKAVIYGLASIAKAKAKSDAQKSLMGRVMFFTEQLPPVTPKQRTGRWISVSERLPEDGQDVLFCDIDNDIMVGYHVKGRPDTHFSQDGTNEDMKNVRAWMPLPKPYEPQTESEE